MTYWNGNIIGKRISVAPESTSGIFNLQSHFPYIAEGSKWPRIFVFQVGGLAGKFFNGSFRSTIGAGNIGSIPLTDVNESSNVVGSNGMPSADHRFGLNVWDTIDYNGNPGTNYGFIAIGYFKAPSTGTFEFDTTSDDGSGVWIGANALEGGNRNTSNAVVNNGMGSGHGSQTRSGTISLTQDVFYPIRVVHEEAGGGDNMRLRWRVHPTGTLSNDLSQYFYYAAVNNAPTGHFF